LSGLTKWAPCPLLSLAPSGRGFRFENSLNKACKVFEPYRLVLYDCAERSEPFWHGVIKEIISGDDGSSVCGESRLGRGADGEIPNHQCSASANRRGSHPVDSFRSRAVQPPRSAPFAPHRLRGAACAHRSSIVASSCSTMRIRFPGDRRRGRVARHAIGRWLDLRPLSRYALGLRRASRPA
jgi:hypothetical protein